MDEMLYSIRRQMLMDLFSDENYKPLKLKELCMMLNVPRNEKTDLKIMLDRMISEELVTMTDHGRYKKLDPNELTGTFSGTARGFGFVALSGQDKDVFIPEDQTLGALHGDTVRIQITEDAVGGRRAEGQVVKIVVRANDTLIGTYEKNKNYGFVIPDNPKISKDIFIQQGKSKGAVTGHKVIVKILDYGSKNKNPEGQITEIIGHIDDPETDVLSVIKAYNIPLEFPEAVDHQLASIPEAVRPSDFCGRLDLRQLQTVTIDGEDAKDLDDAITIEKQGDIYHLGVHIADVSHYVTENSPLDREALKRGTSVYLVDRVIPMLPHQLSNGICSLNQGVDRLALSCLMDIDSKGNVLGHQIAETVICVDRRMTYTAVNQIVTDRDPQMMMEYADFVPMFDIMKEAADVLRAKRRQRGGIDFDFPESKIVLDKKGRPVDIYPYERNAATKIIEDFMLVANETIAEDFFWQELPFLYRTHETPDPERIEKLTEILKNFGYYMKVGREQVHPKEFQKLLGKIEDTPEEAMISRLALRSMKQARYTTENTGHFGLAVKYYCHFTSPIRRYPDLQIHRIIKENLAGKLGERRQNHYFNLLPDVAISTSSTERRADEAEREVERLKKVEYMSERIGKIYDDGVISGMTNYGIYVELPNTCEGMIRLQSFDDDYYIYDEQKFMLIGEYTGKTWHLGQKISVCVYNTDKISRTIDFVPVNDDDPESIYYRNYISGLFRARPL
ncbi:MAG: ribonuclease R [Catenibacillus sp.]